MSTLCDGPQLGRASCAATLGVTAASRLQPLQITLQIQRPDELPLRHATVVSRPTANRFQRPRVGIAANLAALIGNRLICRAMNLQHVNGVPRRRTGVRGLRSRKAGDAGNHIPMLIGHAIGHEAPIGMPNEVDSARVYAIGRLQPLDDT